MSHVERRYLVVDDEALPRKLLSAHLAPYGRCVTSNTPTSAISTFRDALLQRPFDVVFLDILMPEMNGLEVLRRLRSVEQAGVMEQRKHTPIVMVTGVEDLTTVKAAYNELCDGYLTKPVQRDKLHALLEEILLGRRP